MKKAALLALVLLTSAAPGLFALPADIQSELSAKYEKQVLMLRRPVQSNFQKYDAAGNLIGYPQPGSWTTLGAIQITHLRNKGGFLVMEGTRLVYGYDAKQKILLPYKLKDKTKVKVQMEMPGPLTSVADADATIDRIFTRNDDELIDSVPDYWRPYLRKLHAHTAESRDPAPQEKAVALPAAKEPRKESSGYDVVKIDNKHVRAPRARYTPEPSYEEFARKIRLQGVVVLTIIVDPEGNVKSPAILIPVGVGLDDKAVEAVRRWKFEPATMDGKPVAVEMAIEVSFNLY